MKILQLSKFYPPAVGGIELVAENFSRAFIQLGHEVEVFSFGKNEQHYQGQWGEKVFEFQQRFSFMSAPWPKNLFKILSAIHQENYDLIVVHLPNPIMHQLLLMGKNRHCKIFGVYHSDIVGKGFIGLIYETYFKLTSKMYQKMIFSSKALEESSSYLQSLKEKRKCILPFPTAGKQVYKERAKFNNQLITVGRMVSYKGLDFLIESIKDSKYQLHLVGDGPLREHLEKLANKASNIHFYGQVDEEEKGQLLLKAGLFVSASINRAETFGMGMAEALECGLPLVASRIDSGVTFLARHEETGLTYEIKDKHSLMKSLERMENDCDFYSRCSKEARNFYQKNLSFEGLCLKLKELLHS